MIATVWNKNTCYKAKYNKVIKELGEGMVNPN